MTDAKLSLIRSRAGRKGGKAGKGVPKSKPITSEQARKNVMKRWERYRIKLLNRKESLR